MKEIVRTKMHTNYLYLLRLSRMYVMIKIVITLLISVIFL